MRRGEVQGFDVRPYHADALEVTPGILPPIMRHHAEFPMVCAMVRTTPVRIAGVLTEEGPYIKCRGPSGRPSMKLRFGPGFRRQTFKAR